MSRPETTRATPPRREGKSGGGIRRTAGRNAESSTGRPPAGRGWGGRGGGGGGAAGRGGSGADRGAAGPRGAGAGRPAAAAGAGGGGGGGGGAAGPCRQKSGFRRRFIDLHARRRNGRWLGEHYQTEGSAGTQAGR